MTTVLRIRRGTTGMLLLASAGGVLAFLWPLFTSPQSPVAHASDAPLIFAAIIPLIIAVVVADLASGSMDAKGVAMLGILTALGAMLRPLSAGTAGIELVFFLLVLAGRVFGPGFGFLLGSTTLFASALVTAGVGPWLPFQMLAASWVGLGAGLLPPVRGRLEVAMLAIYGAVSAFLYGTMMNLWFWPFAVGVGTNISFVAGASVLDNLRRFAVYSVGTSLVWDLGRAATNLILIGLLGRPILGVLRRAAHRAAFDAEVHFDREPA